MIVQQAVRRFSRLLTVFMAFMLAVCISACGDKTNTDANGAEQSAQTNSPQPAVQTKESQTQKVNHVYGETEVPAHPERIAVHGFEDIMLSLNAPMVYAFSMDGYYLDDQLKELKVPTFNTWAPNLEAILAEQPDLILISKNAIDQDAYDQLSKIAPTVAFDPSDWKTNIVDIGRMLGLEDQAQAVIQAYDDKIKQAKETIVQAVGIDKTVSFMRPSEKDVYLFTNFTFGRVLYNDLGLLPAKMVEDTLKTEDGDVGASLSLEQLPDFDSDYLFVVVGGSISTVKDYQEALDNVIKLEESQLWMSIPAAKQNHVFNVSARHWMSVGPIAASMGVDDVVAAVTGKQQP
ncbi:ABC transporter substrate-binding protein [Cohnella cellulosilytica]|uniref:ABC transporter substrate-binding protein n=1 Tax=Cohnella cellulosilytica TaxID=986710 RepID=A0ABW2FKK2_9BACL